MIIASISIVVSGKVFSLSGVYFVISSKYLILSMVYFRQSKSMEQYFQRLIYYDEIKRIHLNVSRLYELNRKRILIFNRSGAVSTAPLLFFAIAMMIKINTGVDQFLKEKNFGCPKRIKQSLFPVFRRGKQLDESIESR